MSQQKKYTLIPEFDQFRIRALIDIPEYLVKKGDLGGLIDGEHNLPQDKKGWVSRKSTVQDDAIVYDAFVCGKSLVKDSVSLHSGIIENSNLYGDLLVKGQVRITNSSIGDGAFIVKDDTEKGIIQDSKLVGVHTEATFVIKDSTVKSNKGLLFEDSVIMKNSIIDIEEGNAFYKCNFDKVELKLNELYVGQELGLFYVKMLSGILSIEGHDLKPNSSSVIRGEKDNSIVANCEHLILCDTKIKGSCSLKGSVHLESCKIKGITKIHLHGVLKKSTVKDFAVVDSNLSKFNTIQNLKLSCDEVYTID